MNIYPQGEVVRAIVTFRDTRSGQTVDPTTVRFSYQAGAGNAFTSPVTWDGTNPSPGVNVIGRLGVGRYEAWISTEDWAGIGTYLYDAEGAGQSEVSRSFSITPRPT